MRRRLTRDGRIAMTPGRKPTGRRIDPRHRPRPPVVARHPVHVVFRVVPAMGDLRRRDLVDALRGALGVCLVRRADCRIVRLGVEADRLHLLVEADDGRALAHGMQGFAISAARRLNRALGGRHGQVWAYRYDATPITTPAQARAAIAAVAPPGGELPLSSPTAWLLTVGVYRAPRAASSEKRPGPRAEMKRKTKQ